MRPGPQHDSASSDGHIFSSSGESPLKWRSVGQLDAAQDAGPRGPAVAAAAGVPAGTSSLTDSDHDSGGGGAFHQRKSCVSL